MTTVLHEATGLRDEVMWFAQAMERELRTNDHKSGWHYLVPGDIRRRLKQEVDELFRAMERGESRERVLSEAADVGNFLMMAVDNYVATVDA